MLNTYDDLVKHLDILGMFRMNPGQDSMKIALENLCLLPLPYKAIQIVGTNGKGSTSTFLSYLAKEHGMKVGLYTSPHFISPKERILYNNEQLSDEIWLSAAQKVYAANPELTYFEFLTVLAAQIYADLNVDIVFFEAGLGGKFDATTALECPVTVFTPVALDHCSVLGYTIQEIACDKARAINSWTKFAITSKQNEDALHEIQDVAKEFNVPLYQSIYDGEEYELGMNGLHQHANARLALDTWDLLCKHILDSKSEEIKRDKALKEAFLPGRVQCIKNSVNFPNKTLVLDGAHNAHGIHALAKSLQNLSISPKYIVFSCLEDKVSPELFQYIEQLSNKSTLLIPTISENPRAVDSDELAQHFDSSSFSSIIPYKTLDECMTYIQNSVQETRAECSVLICGSLYLLSEFYVLFPQCLLRHSNVQ